MLLRRTLPFSSTRTLAGIALMARARVVAFALLVHLGACTREPPPPAELVHLIAAPPGAPPPTYTLADETRPVLAAPRERRLDLPVPQSDDTAYTFTVPDDVTGDILATGTLQRANHTYPVTPQLLVRSTDPDGSPRATLTLPDVARGPGPPATLTLRLTPRPETTTVETLSDAIAVPPDARLELAVGVSPASAVRGAAPVTLEIAARPEQGAEQQLFSLTLQLEGGDATRWREVAVPLGPLGGRRVRFAFRARAVGDGPAVVLPLWADPTIVGPAPRPVERRNVVLISIDTLRADRLAAYGAYRPAMPQVDAFARDAVVFANAWSVWPETSGSHMSLFSSRYPSEHGVQSFITAPPPSIDLLAERLRRAGYLTRAFTEDGGVWAYAGFARGFSAYSERRSPDFVYRGEVDATFADATRWVEAHADRTFFLFVHTYQVHEPYTPPLSYRALFADVPGREPEAGRAAALAYDQEARFTDDHVGPFLATLARLKLTDRTIVVFTSDHGEEFAEHGGMGHGRSLYREVLRVPLVVAAPGLLTRSTVTTPASLLDVAPTLLELLALPADVHDRGTSLVANARQAAAGSSIDPDTAARPLFAELDRVDRGRRIQMVAVRRGGAAAIRDLGTDTVSCYGPDDREERHPEGSACPELAELIELHRQASRPAGTSEAAPPADPQLIEKMRALGYLQ